MRGTNQTPEGRSLLTIPLFYEEERGKHGGLSNEEATVKLGLLMKIEET